ncbi:MAG: outer membrane protein assembly factor BamC, partial [Gammaproteobacteria bacterium]|nr:outer membrane protein assembly factor BamC [Gammaproteobacteria bacterium]
MLRVVLVVTLLLNLIACSSTPGWKGIYSSEIKDKDMSKLDVPPDLSQPNVSDSLALPNIAAAGSTYSTFTNTSYKGDKVTPANPQGVRVVRDGANQWLEIHAPAEKLWSQLRVFFTEVGFEVKREDINLGIMETNWQENRAPLPTNWLSKLLNRISSTGLRDKYRARLEKTNKPDVTRVFITHQGLKEHASDEVNSVKIWWATRPSDPDLEAEMYQRFLIFRDISRADAKKLFAKANSKERTQIIDKNGTQMLQVGEGFARTWRRVGIALDRIGLLVEDRNRSDGVYYLRITEDFNDRIKEDKGWLSSLFSKGNVKLKERYLLSVSDEKDKTIISIVETTGAKADSRFVNQLLKDL